MKKIILPLLLILVAGLAAGLAVGYAFGAKSKIPSSGKVCINETAAQIKDKLVKTGAIREYANSLSGKILSVQGNEVKFEAPLVNPLQDESLKSRIAVVTAATKIYVSTPRTQAEMDKAIEDSAGEISKLQAELSASEVDIKDCFAKSGGPTGCTDAQKRQQTIQVKLDQLRSLSAASVRTEGTMSDIKPGWLITVSAGKDEKAAAGNKPGEWGVNIANEPKFEVVAVEISPMPVKEAMPPGAPKNP